MKIEVNYKKMCYHADKETLEAVAELKKHHISISSLVQAAIKAKADQLRSSEEVA